MLIINCKGTPYEIGFEHGSKAARQIRAGIDYYKPTFLGITKMDWPGVCQTALKFDGQMQERYPWLREEMQAIADGANVQYAEILALNFRQEIIFGLFADGCTSLAWKTPEKSFLAQNWDWLIAQKDNVIILNIDAPGKPRISMGTEAGIIGKIGLNSAGVGVCANGIRVRGVNFNGTPVHICRRLILESTSREAAVAAVEKYGTAASGHMLIGDRTGSVGLECTTAGIIKLPMDNKGRILHTNHLLEKHSGVYDNLWLKDSPIRYNRLKVLADQLGRNPSEAQIAELFKDEDNLPHAICREREVKDPDETLFNILMDLSKGTAIFKFGRPVAPDEVIILAP